MQPVPNISPAKSLEKCSDCPIQHRAVCAYCDKTELLLLETIKSYKTYEAGSPITFVGDHMEFVGSVVTGVATLSQTMEDGRRQMVGLLLPSDFVGRPGREYAAFNVEATTDVTLCKFARKPFEKLLNDMPHLRERMLEMALDELDAAREWMLLLGRKTAREKIASLLMIIAKRQNTLKPIENVEELKFELSLTREAMADYLGLTLETVSRQINALKKDGVIELERKRHVFVKDITRLLNETGDDADGGYFE
ncbi:Crp/Fnr family transcriptional regulator [Amylibacter sp. SFDW26]|uniref:transcriptional regulator FnrL n=1 Tax=Amylibacter sp. SFDW26 TaxID=2652722 RepID=UPI0012622497|nr:Crp/Fnr family transcriptional regulator [Amylibacter sp. SFDW26]